MRRAIALLIAAGAALLSLAVALPAGAGTMAGRPGVSTSSSRAAAPCAAGSVCVSIRAGCRNDNDCPTVVAAPTTYLESSQWIYLTLEHFPASSVAEIYLCSDRVALSATQPPACLEEGLPSFTYPSQSLPVGASRTAETSFQVQSDPHTKGDSPFPGETPGDTSSPVRPFYCDDAANPCSVDVVDPQLLPASENASGVPQPADTAVIPLDFAPASNGCARAQIVSSYGDFSIEQLLPHESATACKQANAAIPLYTATDTETALDALNEGAAEVDFIEDPQDPLVARTLASSGHQYAIVPIVASAVVIGYQAAMKAAPPSILEYPFSSFRLTPTEVAGLVTYNYQGPFDADIIKCPLKGEAKCSALEELNSVAGFTPAGTYGSFIPSEISGVTETLTNWLCTAKNLPFKIDGKLVHDPNTAARTLTTSDYDSHWPIKSCTAFDQFPPIQSPSSGVFGLVSDPAHQVKYLRAFAIPAAFQPAPLAAFAPMDWGDSRFFGLDDAAIQNAVGRFVAPSTQSVEAELAAWKIGPEGYPLPDPTARVAGGYPLATVIDAVVPTDHLAPSEAKGIADMLHELVHYVATAKLPEGYAPLPAGMERTAKAELAAVLAKETAKLPSTTTKSTVASPTTVPATTAPPTTVPATTVPATTLPPTTVPATTVPTTAAPPTTATTPRGAARRETTEPTSAGTGKAESSGLPIAEVELAASGSSLALPLSLVLGACLIALSAVLSGIGLARKRKKR